MEGMAFLFKKFSGIDVFDFEVAATDLVRLVDVVAALEPTFALRYLRRLYNNLTSGPSPLYHSSSTVLHFFRYR